jgi:hypothetical protein
MVLPAATAIRITNIAAKVPITEVAALLSCEAGPLSKAEPRCAEACTCLTIVQQGARAFPITVVADAVGKPPFGESSVKFAG